MSGCTKIERTCQFWKGHDSCSLLGWGQVALAEGEESQGRPHHFSRVWWWVKPQISALGFPGSLVVKNLPANAGDSSLSPHPGRFHIPWSSSACATQLLSLCAAPLKPAHPQTYAPQQEKPLQWEARTPQLETSSRLLQLEKNPHSNEDLAQLKIN